MTNLDRDLPDLNFSRKLNVSKIFYEEKTLPMPRSHSVEFIPFCQERDSMGRLLSYSRQLNKLSMGHSLSESQVIQEETHLK